MSTRKIVLDGVEYIHIKEAAQTADLGTDYIARLCRGGAVRGIKRDRVWWVNEDSLKSFLITQAHQKAHAWQMLSRERRAAYNRAQSVPQTSRAVNRGAF